jgi:predicted metal-dependent peptidase
MTTFPQELQAARLRLVKERPYLAAAAWALQPVARPGLGTLAVDRWWRVYFDPAVAQRWTVEELAGVLYHEICHLLRDHAARMENYDHAVANLATDMEINDDLLRESIKLPGTPVTPAAIGQPEGLLAEEYVAALQAQQLAPGRGAPAQPEATGGEKSPSGAEGGREPEAGDTCQGGGDEAGDRGPGAADPDAGDGSAQGTASASAPGSGAENGPGPSPTVAGGSQAGDATSGGGGDASGLQAGDACGTKPDGGAESSFAPASGLPQASSARPGTASRPAGGPVDSGRAAGAEGAPPEEDRAQEPAPGAGRCGSCATGRQEPWEEGPPGEGIAPGVARAEAELIRRDVARAIREASQSRGDVPGHWRRWAEEKLRPKVDWRRELAAAVRHALADTAGAADYTYRRPSRRQGQAGNGRVVLPALRWPVPEVAVVVDTSGSMSDAQLARALAEVRGVLRAAGLRQGVTVLTVDAAVRTCQRVFDARQVVLAGGGGTDMGAGLESALRLRPRPQVVVVLTDGYTPWPDAPPRGARVVVGLLGGGEAPAWARAVKIREG